MSWLSNLFGGEQSYFFGIQILIKAFGEDELRARLAQVIEDQDLENIEAKRRYIKRIVALLLEQAPYWSQGFWDYKTTHAEAEAEFQSWLSELSASTATEAEEFSSNIDGMNRVSKQKDYVAITLIFHIDKPYPPANIDDESLYWQQSTFKSLIEGLLYINPETIIQDGIFIMPGSPEDGLSEEDLLMGGWSYLHILT